MIIGVDAGPLSITDDRLKVGVYRVTLNLLENLARVDKKNTYRLYTFRPIERGISELLGPRMENRVLPQRGWSSWWLPRQLKQKPVDVFLGVAQSLPTSSSYNIGFIYDVGFLHQPESYGSSANVLKKQTQNLVNRSDMICTISQYSKLDIINVFDINETSVKVFYPGVEKKFFLQGDPLAAQAGLQKKVPYFLFVGSLNQAKNIPRLIEVFVRFLAGSKKHYQMYLVGGEYWPDPAIDRAIKKFHSEHTIVRLGHVPDDMLPLYYRGAAAFVTLSRYEGFCLPAAEAMACGCPVIAARRGALPEVVGEAGVLVDPDDRDSAVAAFERVSTDQKLQTRLAHAGIKRAERFRWETFARGILKEIEKAKRSL